MIFVDNMAAVLGGAIYSDMHSNIFFTQYSTVFFIKNRDKSLYTKGDSSVTITANATVTFNNHTFRFYGDVPYFNKYGIQYSDVAFDSNGTVTCSDPETLLVCIHQSCFCQVINRVLDGLTSNTHIDLSINVTLSSTITLSNLSNISIIGQNNPTISCSSNGGVKFTSCHNCTIEGISWDGCGAEYVNGSIDPVIKFWHSTNITIHNCTFQHSVGQAIILSEVTGSVNINHCKFLCNKHYEGDGAAIYYSSNEYQKHSQLCFIISNCNFSENKMFNSIVYIGQYNIKSQLLVLNNSVFVGNHGTTLYLQAKI